MKNRKIEEKHSIIALQAYKNIIERISPLYINEEGIEKMNSSVENDSNLIDCKLGIDKESVFYEFLSEPQIVNLLIKCLEVEITSVFVDEKTKKAAYVDNCINYCEKIIVENYGLIADEESLFEIKKILNNLLMPKISLLELLMETNIFEGKSKSEYITLIAFFYRRKPNGIYQDCVNELEKNLSSEFVLRNKVYEREKQEYQKVLRTIYQNGFIYFVGEYKFNEFYVPPILLEGQSVDINTYMKTLSTDNKYLHNRKRDKWIHIFDFNNIIYVIGGAGYGKSLFLKNAINNYTKLNVFTIKDYLLIYCDLKTFYSTGEPNKKTILDFLEESMINLTGVSVTKELIEYYLKRGQCVILLDALDEVPKIHRSDLHKKIVAFFNNCNPNNKICITSRDRGFIPQEEIDVFHILPLVKYDIEEYLDKMIGLKKFKKEEKNTFLEQAEVLIKKEFLNSFLVLSLLVHIYKSEKELPENKIDLYKKCFDYIANKREEEKSKIGYNWKNIGPLMKDSTFISLSRLAIPNNSDIDREMIEELLKKQYSKKYVDEAEAECAIKEFLEFCSNRTELFVPSTVDDKFKFFHRSFFEYFYARYIYQQSSIEEMYKLMTEFDVDSEVFELTVALVKQDNEEKYQELVSYIFEEVYLDFKNEHSNFVAFGILTLAMQVVDDVYFVNKYYEILLLYVKNMQNKKVMMLNQDLLYNWAINGIAKNDDMKEQFKDAYEDLSVKHFLQSISTIKRFDKDNINAEIYNSNEQWSHTIWNEVQGFNLEGFRMVPFYFRVYCKFYDIRDAINKLNKNSFNDWMRRLGKLSKNEISSIKKGYKLYKSLTDENIENLINEFIKI